VTRVSPKGLALFGCFSRLQGGSQWDKNIHNYIEGIGFFFRKTYLASPAQNEQAVVLSLKRAVHSLMFMV
jgi:hypothetical protein